jgi:acyl-homoserine-lactone acylase
MKRPVHAATLLAALLLCACSDNNDDTPAPPPTYAITFSTHGVPHITAPSLLLAAQGMGDAYAQQNLCLLQQSMLTVNGERSKVFGPDVQSIDLDRNVNNLDSDFFYRFVIETAKARAVLASSPQGQAMMQAYAQGVNAYMARTPKDAIDPACAAFAREVTLDDMARLYVDKITRAGAVSFMGPIANAGPQASTSVAAAQRAPAPTLLAGYPGASDAVLMRPLASNAWAFGRDVMASGKAMLFANPHFPWTGSERFSEARITVPGLMDVSGVALSGLPFIGIGYNKHMAWTHTISAARRFTLHELTLKQGDVLSHVVDGVEKKLTAVEVEVPLAPAAGGAPQSRKRTLYRSEYGPMLVLPALGLGWNATRAYALQDVNLDNGKVIDTYIEMAQAKSVKELQQILAKSLGVPYFNTIAADDSGEVLYADLGAVPRVESADIERCRPSPGAAALLKAASIVVLNGSNAGCNWKKAAPAPHSDSLLPAERQAWVIRTDYVFNANNSYALANPAHRFAADLSPMMGPVDVPQGGRVRNGLRAVQARLAGTDGLPGNRFDPASMMTLWARNEGLFATVLVDDLLALVCGGVVPNDIVAACEVLRDWDRTSRLDSRGAPLFREFWRLAAKRTDVSRVPFDPADPINTPAGFRQDAATATMLVADLRNAIAKLKAQGLSENASLRQTQFGTQGVVSMPMPGADELEGVLNKTVAPAGLVGGRYEVIGGTSWLQVVQFGAGDPVKGQSNANGFLSYSQSTDPRSPHFNDQLSLFSTLTLRPLPDLR